MREAAKNAPYSPDDVYDPANTSVANGGIGTAQDCPIMTPGSTIAESLNLHLGSALRQTELADEINEIINALFSQLVTQVLTKGLGAVSGSGPSDSTSYINQIQNEANGDASQINAIRRSLLQDIDLFIQNSVKYKAIKQSSYDYLNAIQTNYVNARACYVNVANTAPLQSGIAQSRIAAIDSIFAATTTDTFASKLIQVQRDNSDATFRLTKLQSIKTGATNATTLDQLNAPNQDYLLLIQTQGLTSASEVARAEQEFKDIKKDFKDDSNRSENELRTCQSMSALIPSTAPSTP
jgi:hypothetical protein